MTMKINSKWLLWVALTFVACNHDDSVTSEASVTSGVADFSKYVALGDSFAAGYSDNALFYNGQNNAYPNIMAKQFAAGGGGVFITPLMSADNVGGFSSGGVQVPQFSTRLYFNGSAPVNVAGVSGTAITDRLSGTFNNMGIPGAKSFHLTYSGYASANPYFGRIASSISATVLQDAMSQNPTFFSLWIGGNDVLGYATNGGVPTSQDAVNGNDITPPATFDFVYKGIVAQLVAGGAKGVVANLPYVSTLPYFTTVPYNPVPLDTATANLLNGASGFGTYNAGIQYALANNLLSPEEAARRTITFHAGTDNAVVMVDSYLTDLSGYNLPSYRQATNQDLLVLPSKSIIGTVVGGNPLAINGVSVPLADNWVLSKEEILEVKNATDAYNVTIAAAASANQLAYVDSKRLMDQLASPNGYVFGAYTMKATYVTGGAFSLDGVHPSPRGYALIANAFLDAINAKYGATFKKVDSKDYPVLYPKMF